MYKHEIHSFDGEQRNRQWDLSVCSQLLDLISQTCFIATDASIWFNTSFHISQETQTEYAVFLFIICICQGRQLNFQIMLTWKITQGKPYCLLADITFHDQNNFLGQGEMDRCSAVVILSHWLLGIRWEDRGLQRFQPPFPGISVTSDRVRHILNIHVCLSRTFLKTLY